MAVAFLAALGVRAVCAYWCPVLRWDVKLCRG
uniref:4Fe-4S ferredoxin-type domain-containing protein n=1 Tax=Peronospora matthiolae TaxID=2874970 RepID=A0AAV1SZM0_9STRA